ncbi:hypothetical protein [Erwinia aphidicola]|uniref:Uncharacterized protein n=1 Tax=Erwinia aphidicola TaxID=68334 RepID=A0ABU8DL56_ERWAP
MITPCFDDNIFSAEKRPKAQSNGLVTGIIENHNGNTMLVAETVTIDFEEVEMTINTAQPLTLGWAIGLCIAVVVGAGTIAGTTYALIHSDVNDVRSSVDSVRDGASSDVNSLRADMRADYTRMDSKLDAIALKLDSKIENSSEKTDSKLDKLTDAINGIRQSKPAN